jgi:hypothetical protein
LSGNSNSSEIRSLVVNSPPASSSSGGGGGGGSATRNPTDVKVEKFIEFSEVESWKLEEVDRDTILYLEIGKDNYTLDAQNFSSLEITILVNNKSYDLKLNNPLKIDLDKDHIYDLELLLVSSTESDAKIYLKRIYEQIPTKKLFDRSLNSTGEGSDKDIGDKKISLNLIVEVFSKFVIFIEKNLFSVYDVFRNEFFILSRLFSLISPSQNIQGVNLSNSTFNQTN